MNYKMKEFPFVVITIGLIGVLIAAAYIAIIVIVPKTSMVGSGEGAGIIVAFLYMFGSVIALAHIVIGLLFLPLHIGHHKNKRSDRYFWILLFFSAIIVLTSASFLFKLVFEVSGKPISDFIKLLVISIGCGTLLPFSIITCGCVVNIANRMMRKISTF